MPQGGLNKEGRPQTAKVFDTFAAVGDGELAVVWPDADVSGAVAATIDRLLGHLTYLGRAESWVEARRLGDVPAQLNCVPSATGELALQAVTDDDAYQVWRAGFVEGQSALAKKQRREPPVDWWQVLQLDTGRLFAEGWSRPPGTRMTRYQLRELPPRRASHAARPVDELPVAARFEITSQVLPRLTEALAIGDRLRQALIKRTDGHPVFVGRHDGAVAIGHKHAFILPSDDNADGFLDHIVVFAEAGFDERARTALGQIRRVWGHGGHDLYLTLVDMGGRDIGGRRHERARLAPQLTSARVWESHTPFVPPRHAKRRGGQRVETPVDQLARLIHMRGLRTPTIEPVEAGELSAPQPSVRPAWYRFRRIRYQGGGSRGSQGAYGFRLTFPEPVAGPLAFGYGAHQGLGQFVAIADEI
jgi:CRISPR-associated protein Csb2